MKRPFFGWPGGRQLGEALLLSALCGLWFGFVYGGCEWITAHRVLRVQIHLPIEFRIPFVPAAVLFYDSIYVLFLAGPFILRERREFRAVVQALALAILCGGLGFLLLPATAAYPPPGELGIWRTLYESADRLNLDYNMAPSLHVALAVCCAAAFARHAARWGRVLLWAWAGAIALSTLLTHQHHVLDVILGWALGVGSVRFASRAKAESESDS